jgi:hypothetical protein
MARIIQELSGENPRALTTLKSAPPATQDSLTTMLATQYISYVKSTAFTVTNRELRDFFSAMSTKPGSEKVLTEFFIEFIKEALSDEMPAITRDIKPSQIAGLVMKHYKSGPKEDLTVRTLRTIKTSGVPGRTLISGENTLFGLPDEKFCVPPVIEDISFGDIINKICNPGLQADAEKLHFLLHLLYTLEHLESAPAAAPAAAT